MSTILLKKMTEAQISEKLLSKKQTNKKIHKQIKKH